MKNTSFALPPLQQLFQGLSACAPHEPAEYPPQRFNREQVPAFILKLALIQPRTSRARMLNMGA
jgi:hypothetical protein